MKHQEFITFLFFIISFVQANEPKNTDRNLRTRKKRGRTFRRAIRPTGDPETIRDSNGNVRLRRSRLNLRQLILGDEEDDVDIQLMSDQEAQSIRVRRGDTNADPFESWFGLDTKTGSSFTMVKTVTRHGREVTTGTLYGKNGTVYQIRSLADGDVIAEEVKQEMFPKDVEGPETNSGDDDDIDPDTIDQIDGLPTNRRQLRRLDSSSEIDIMVLYTKAAMCAAAGYGSGGTCTVNANNLAAIEGLVNLAIAETNQAYQLSNIPTRLRLVKTHYDAIFNENLYDWVDVLSLIRNNGDGQLDYVHAMRDQYGADFVSIIVDIGSYCGIGYRPTSPTAGDAFSVVQWSCATGYYSFGHEVAHNMGCNHDRANSGATDSNINYGYQDPDSSFRTIMAYDCKGSCPRIQYFSNPSLNLNGRSLGDKRSDNASWIRKYLAAFANFRPSVNILPFNSNPILSLEPTSSPTVAPTRPPTNEQTFTVDLQGGYVGAEGNMFDIRATTNLYIRNFAVHALAATEVTVEVWKKRTLGTCIGTAISDSGQWQLIGQASFVSNPTGTASPLPEGTIPAVFVKAGDIQAFYITFAAVTNYNRYNAGEELGAIYKTNEHLQVFEGYAIWYAFSGYFSPRIWNGVIYYELDTVSNVNPTSSLTSQPSMQGQEFLSTSTVAQPSNIETPTQNIQPNVQPSFPTTIFPSSQPVIILPPTLQPTPPPTMQPTMLPTLQPTMQPTIQPTMQPTIQPTMQPTIQPTLEQLPNSISSVTLNPVSRQRITTTFKAKSGQAGNMFEIQASRGLTVTSMDIHTASKSNVTVLVYFKKGTYIGYQSQRNAWTRIVNTTIKGLGSFIPTPIPEKVFSPVPLAAGEIASFYVTLTRPQIRYTSYSRRTLLPSDASVRFIRSSGNAYLFGSSYSNKLWNGILYYSSSVNTV